MAKGAFEKENRPAYREEKQAKATQEKQAPRRKRKTSRKKRLLLPVFAVVILLAIVVLLLAGRTGNPLVGRWSIDEVTVYEFDRDGTGAMILPTSEYAFQYKIQNNRVSIDFERDEAKDAEYEFEVSGDAIVFTGGNATNQGIYVLTRQEAE